MLRHSHSLQNMFMCPCSISIIYINEVFLHILATFAQICEELLDLSFSEESNFPYSTYIRSPVLMFYVPATTASWNFINHVAAV